jgi:hypothetical protein
MSSLQSLHEEVGRLLKMFLEDHLWVGGSVQRYDGEISPAFANSPHLDLYLWCHYQNTDYHAGRPSYKEDKLTRLAKLRAVELSLLVNFANDLSTLSHPVMEVVLSRYDAGRCVFVITPKTDETK